MIVVALAVCATLALQLRSRRPAPPRVPAEAPVLAEETGVGEREPGADLVLAPDEVLVLPPASEDAGAVVLAPSRSLEALERAGIMTPRAKRRPFQQLVDRVALERRNGERRRLETLADEPLEGGYLKLSDESRRQLEAGKPVVTRTGELLGMVNDDKGHRRYLLRFTDYKVAADPNLVMAAANLQALAGLQEQLEAVEERLIEVQQTLETLCKELDRDRLASITAATEMLEETARHIRRRGRMTPSDWDHVAATRLTIKTQLTAARFNLADLTRDFEDARSRRQRVEVLQTILKDNRLDFWLSMFVEAELAHIGSDLLTLLHESTEYPESLGDLEHRTRESIEARRAELATVGSMLRDLGDPEARRWFDHFQQISHYRLARQRPVVDGLLDAHGDVFAEQPLLTAASD